MKRGSGQEVQKTFGVLFLPQEGFVSNRCRESPDRAVSYFVARSVARIAQTVVRVIRREQQVLEPQHVESAATTIRARRRFAMRDDDIGKDWGQGLGRDVMDDGVQWFFPTYRNGWFPFTVIASSREFCS